MANPGASERTLPNRGQYNRQEELAHDDGSSLIAQVSALCCALLTVYLPGIPAQSVCEVSIAVG